MTDSLRVPHRMPTKTIAITMYVYFVLYFFFVCVEIITLIMSDDKHTSEAQITCYIVDLLQFMALLPITNTYISIRLHFE